MGGEVAMLDQARLAEMIEEIEELQEELVLQPDPMMRNTVDPAVLACHNLVTALMNLTNEV